MFRRVRENLTKFAGSFVLLAMFASPLCAQVVQRTIGERLISLLDDGLGPPQTPHPAVVRVSVPEGDGIAYGSGTLVDVNDSMGLVVTNWHVVAEGRGPITVRFPDGFESPAQVLKTDRDWDLAALAIRRPNVAPVRIANQAPRPGESLTIAGYGSGNYRSASGPCTQYVAPGTTFPYEMVELRARARQGDSGGPIFNSRGELAGVLFGEGGGTTSGSYCGRVHLFLRQLALPTAGAIPATTVNPASVAKVVPVQRPQPSSQVANPPASTVPIQGFNEAAPVTLSTATATSRADRTPQIPLVEPSWQPHRSGSVAAWSSRNEDWSDWALWQALLGDTQSERIKSILAAIGVLLLLFNTHQWVSGGTPRKQSTGQAMKGW